MRRCLVEITNSFNGRRRWPLYVRCCKKKFTFAVSSPDEFLFLFGGICETAICPVRDLSSPRVGNPQSSWRIRELSSYRCMQFEHNHERKSRRHGGRESRPPEFGVADANANCPQILSFQNFKLPGCSHYSARQGRRQKIPLRVHHNTPLQAKNSDIFPGGSLAQCPVQWGAPLPKRCSSPQPSLLDLSVRSARIPAIFAPYGHSESCDAQCRRRAILQRTSPSRTLQVQ